MRHLNAQLTLQTRKKYSSVAPQEHRRAPRKYEVMGNMWLLAQLRQPGRSVFSDLATSTFQKFLKQLHGFQFAQQIQGTLISPPCWEHCMSYEFGLRKEAYSAVERVQQSTASDDALVAVGQSGKLPTIELLVVRTRQSPEGARRPTKRSSPTFPHACPTAKARAQQRGRPSRMDNSLPFQLPRKEEPRALRRGVKRKGSKEKARAARRLPEEPCGIFLTCCEIPVSQLSSRKTKTAKFVSVFSITSVMRFCAGGSMSALVAEVQSHTTSATACSRGLTHSRQHERQFQPLKFSAPMFSPSCLGHQ